MQNIYYLDTYTYMAELAMSLDTLEKYVIIVLVFVQLVA